MRAKILVGDCRHRAVLIELNPEYASLSERRNQQHGLEF